jgi:hypothetical protein
MLAPDDTSVAPPSLIDFVEPGREAQVSIYWVSICGILGRIARWLRHVADQSIQEHSRAPFPMDLAQRLTDWLHAIPEEIKLPINDEQTFNYDRDVHQLHLPYLASVMLLFSNASPQRAAPASVVAESCVARIFKDILSHGNCRFLAPLGYWYCHVAFSVLRKASQCQELGLGDSTQLDMNILKTALEAMAVFLPHVRILLANLEASVANQSSSSTTNHYHATDPFAQAPWRELLTFATPRTSVLCRTVLSRFDPNLGSGDLDWLSGDTFDWTPDLSFAFLDDINWDLVLE